MNHSDDLLVLASYVNISIYRKKVVDSLSDGIKIPKELAHDTDIRINHISKILSELKGKGLLECINPSVRKGRLYRLTSLGVEVKSVIDDVF